MSATVLQRATILDGGVVDVRIAGETIDTVATTIAPQPDDAVVDLEGHLLLASAVEPHAHLDKAFLAERIENPTGDLMGAILAMQASRHLLDVPDIIERAERAARLMATNGFAAVRTHADTTQEHGLRSIEALLEVKHRVADVIDVQIVALCGWPMTGAAGATNRALLREALEAGADLVGGCPHLEGEASQSATDFFLELAAEFGCRSISTPTRRSTRAPAASRSSPGRARRVPARRDRQPLREPRSAPSRRAAPRSPSSSPRRAST